jgi:hypothetical protein
LVTRAERIIERICFLASRRFEPFKSDPRRRAQNQACPGIVESSIGWVAVNAADN